MIRNDKESQQERARLNRMEIIDAKLSRREMMKYGLLTAGGALVAKSGLSIRAAGASGGGVVSPATTPFIEPLRVLTPYIGSRLQADLNKCSAVVSSDPKEATRAVHQLWKGNDRKSSTTSRRTGTVPAASQTGRAEHLDVP